MLNTDQRQEILNNIRDLVANRHINASNPDQDYRSWLSQLEALRSQLADTSEELFEKQVQTLLCGLQSSHTAFFRETGSAIPAQYAINATLQRVDWPDGLDRWMFLDVVEDGPAHQAGIRPGHLLVKQDGRDVRPPSIPAFHIGESCVLSAITPTENIAREFIVHIPNRAARDRPPMVEPKSLIHRLLRPDVGYIRIHTFPGANGSAFARSLDWAIHDLLSAGIDRLIVDLRGNMGGGIGSLRLMSYLCPGRLPVGYSLTRRKYKSGGDKTRLIRIDKLPSGKAETLWMFVKFRMIHRDRSVAMFTEALGAQPFHGRIVILINEHTKSAAEMVASFASENKLAMLVGSKTAGEVLGGATFSAGYGYKLRIPVAGWYSWEGACIEGSGVTPDVVVPQSAEDLAAGNDNQLAAAVSLISSM